ncbi:hypothetical protein ACSVIJ_07100 [Pseudomonas sp. NCHU5208]|uniref:hypothetical protein n=1 Tax=unclassified Pseudomonas TaxID=196821 RepID=UPI003F95DEA3
MKSSRPKHSKKLFSIGVVLSLLASGFFFWVWYFRYLRLEFNELGRYYDAENQVVYTDAGFVWCLPAFGLLAVAVTQISYRLWRRRANHALKPTGHKSGPRLS